ncbi:MAG: sulfur transferase domain-containing protein [Gammaproteobacteria bacterium]
MKGYKVTTGTVFSGTVFSYIDTAGLISDPGISEAKDLGFRLIIDLRLPDEDGATEEKATAKRVGIRYVNIPLAADDTALNQIARIETILSDEENLPTLIHCESANRVGALWALYRNQQRVDSFVAIEEARAIGLTSREPKVRQLLNLPADAKSR